MRRQPTTRAQVALGVVALLTVALIAPSSAIAERMITLSASEFDLSLAPSHPATNNIMVTNSGDEALTVLVYAVNVEGEEDGTEVYSRPLPGAEDVLASPASWVSIEIPGGAKNVSDTPYLELEPGEESTVEFEVVVPEGAAPGDYNTTIFFEMFEFDDDGTGGISAVSGRTGSSIDLRVMGDVVDDVKIEELTSRGIVIGMSAPYSVRVRNDGNIDKQYSLRLALVDADANVIWTTDVDEEATVYARSDRLYEGSAGFGNVGFGGYQLRAVIDYDKEAGDGEGTVLSESSMAEQGIRVIPFWMAILLLLLIAAPVGYVAYRKPKLRGNGGARDDRGSAPVSAEREPSARTSSSTHAVSSVHKHSRRERNSEAEERRRAREERRMGRDGYPLDEDVSEPPDAKSARPVRSERVTDEPAAPEVSRTHNDQVELWVPDSLFEDDE